MQLRIQIKHLFSRLRLFHSTENTARNHRTLKHSVGFESTAVVVVVLDATAFESI